MVNKFYGIEAKEEIILDELEEEVLVADETEEDEDKPTQFASTIKNRTSQHTNKVFNRVCKSKPKEKLFLKNFQRFKKK
jgi:hypothetical protein